jgi:hypothetical protein
VSCESIEVPDAIATILRRRADRGKYGLVWRCYEQRTGGWNLYLYEIEAGAESLAFQPQLYFDIEQVRELNSYPP